MQQNTLSRADLPKTLVCANNSGSWRWVDRAKEENTMNGIESWVYALRGRYKHASMLQAKDVQENDLVILNLDYPLLTHYHSVLSQDSVRRAKVIGLYEGSLDRVNPYRMVWSQVADSCDLVVAINGYGLDYLRSLTSTRVELIGLPYPVDGMRELAVPLEQRKQSLLLCGWLLERSTDYVAVKDIGLPMVGYERAFKRTLRRAIQHRTTDRKRWVLRAEEVYGDDNLSIYMQTGLKEYFMLARSLLLWVNLDSRYTWARYVIDAAALGIPIITTENTWQGPRLFPDLVVESPYDVKGAEVLARRLIEDSEFYQAVVEQASQKLDWYRPEATVERLYKALDFTHYSADAVLSAAKTGKAHHSARVT